MEFSFEGEKKSSLGSDRLKKAIERNRLKQEKQAKRELKKGTSNIVETDWTSPSSNKISNRRILKSRLSSSSSSDVRSGVATSGSTTFASKFRKGVKKSPAPVKYVSRSSSSSTASRSSKAKKVTTKLIQFIIKSLWLFCFFLIFRLLFAERGVIEYYQRTDIYEKQVKNLDSIILDNKNTEIEIEKIKSNSSYQKKLIRDHLGFISKDEYLILFQRDQGNLPI